MPTSSGELRELLVTCIEGVKAGNLDFNDAKAIAGLAAQVNLSLQVEVNARRDLSAVYNKPIGAMPVGEENVVDMNPSQSQPQITVVKSGKKEPA